VTVLAADTETPMAVIDVVGCIRQFNDGRDPDRLALKYKLMRQNAFVFLRGTCHLFYDRLPRASVFRQAPVTWVCGDLHFQNFGSYKGDNRLVFFDMNDFDEAALAPCTWDLVRFLASILIGTRNIAVSSRDGIKLCNTFMDAYGSALAYGKARWVERETADGLVRELLEGLRGRARPAYLDTRTTRAGKTRRLKLDGKKALPASDEQRSRVISFMQRFAARQPNPAFFEVIDVARRVAGTGSLGVDRFVILVEGKGSPDANYLLDLKQALPSCLIAHLKNKQPSWQTEASRVEAVQRRMQAISMAFLQPVVIGKTSYVLRGLQPSEDRVAFEQWNGKLHRLEGVMKAMGEVVAWGQLRSGGRNGSATIDELIDFGRQRKQWAKPLLEAAKDCAEQVDKDWRVYAESFDAGAPPAAEANRR